MDILRYLLEHPGEPISAQRMLDEVWAGRMVEPQAVHRGINQIRRALDDNPQFPQYIETIRKRGYRVIADVSKSQPSSAAEDSSPRILHAGSRSLFGLAAICAIALIAAALKWGWPEPGTPRHQVDAPRPPLHPQAEALYRQARHLMHTRQGQADTSIELLQRALEIDTESTMLQQELVRAYWQDKRADPRAYWVRVESAVSELERRLAPASSVYAWRGWIAYSRDYNLVSAAHYYGKAVELDHDNVDILRPLVVVLLEMGQVNDAVEVSRYVTLQDPICTVCLVQHAQAADIGGEVEEALDAARRARLLSPDWALPRQIEALLRIQQGEPSVALDLVESLPSHDPGRMWIRSIALHDLEDAEFRVEFAALKELWSNSHPARIAHVHAHIGEREEAFALLAEVRSPHDFIVAGFNDHYWTNLIDDARWPEHQSRLGVRVDGNQGELKELDIPDSVLLSQRNEI